MALRPNLFMDFYTRKVSNKTRNVEYTEFYGYTAM